MIIKNGTVLNHNFVFESADIRIAGEQIQTIEPGLDGEEILDAENLLILPGFVDSHFHGAVGVDFLGCQEDAYCRISEYEGKHGTTTILPTIEAASEERMLLAIRFYEAHKQDTPGARFGGIHLEGPYLNLDRIGAIDSESVRGASVRELKDWMKASGKDLRVITMAPECEGAEEVIRFASAEGVTVSMGHTDASYEEAERGVLWGATRSTHTFNAMSPLNHRAPNMVGCALTNPKVFCELICDFYHIHPAVCKLVFTAKGADKVVMISDSVSSAGLPDGEYTDASGHKFFVKNRQARLEDGTICGGCSCLIDGIKNLVSIGVRLEDAVKAASLTPAESCGLSDSIGSIREGKLADLVLCDKDLNIRYVFVNGKMIYQA